MDCTSMKAMWPNMSALHDAFLWWVLVNLSHSCHCYKSTLDSHQNIAAEGLMDSCVPVACNSLSLKSLC